MRNTQQKRGQLSRTLISILTFSETWLLILQQRRECGKQQAPATTRTVKQLGTVNCDY